MAQFELSSETWTEIIAAGGSVGKTVSVNMGEALVFLGAPDPLRKAIKLGGAADRTLHVPAGIAVNARSVGPRVLLTTGDRSAGGGSSPVVPTNNRLASMTTSIANVGLSVTNNTTMRRIDYATPQGDITNLKCIDCNGYEDVASTPLLASTTNTIKRYLEYPAGSLVLHPVTWDAGAATKQRSGSNSYTSDTILNKNTGQPLVIAAGQSFIWWDVNVTGSTVTTFPLIQRPAFHTVLGLPDSFTGGSDLTNGGNPVSAPAATATLYTSGPVALVGTINQTNAKSFLIVGDSLLEGQGDDTTVGAYAESGWAARGLPYGKAKIAKRGQRATTLATDQATFNSLLALLSPYVTDVIMEQGLNDLSQDSASQSTILTARQSFVTRLTGAGGYTGRIWPTTITARSDSTNGYIDTTNQTPKTDGNMAALTSLNTAIRAGHPYGFMVIDTADYDMSARNSNIHGGPFPPVTDGTHFLSPKAASMGSMLTAFVAANLPA